MLNLFQHPSRGWAMAVREEEWTPDQVRGDDDAEANP